MTDKKDLRNNDGTYHGEEGIKISPRSRPDEQASTLIHELLHAVFEEYGLPGLMGEEDVCTRLEGPLLSLLVDNPHLRTILKGALCQAVPLPIAEDAL